jgi:hypothetical protein
MADLSVFVAGMRLLFPPSIQSSNLKLPVFPRLQFELVCILPHVAEAKLRAPTGPLPPRLFTKVLACRRNGSSMESSQLLNLSVHTACGNSFVLPFSFFRV